MSIGHHAKIVGARYSTFMALLVICGVFTALSPRFLTTSNLQIILLNVAELGVVAIPMALLVMSGSLDLSVGSVASMGAVSASMVMADTGSAVLGILVGLGFGICAGAINGLLVAVLDLNPIVITLGFLGAWGGLALYLTGGATVAGLPAGFTDVARWRIGPVPLQILLLAAVVAIGWYVFARRPFGRELLAVGGSKRAARLMGIRVRRVQFTLFVVTGAAAALAGIMTAGKLFAAPPTLGVGLELNVLLVILIGGVAFEGGAGRVSGVLAGLLFIGALNNGLIIVGVSQFLQAMITGLALVLAIAMDRSIQRGVENAWARIGAAQLAVDAVSANTTVNDRPCVDDSATADAQPRFDATRALSEAGDPQ